MKSVESLISEIKNLKPFPKIAQQLLERIEDPNSSSEDIAELILYDPAITANLLRVCNSAFFSLPRKIESVHEAVNILGMNHIVDLVMVKFGSENFKTSQEGYGLHEGELWRHAVSSALISKDLAARMKIEGAHSIFTASLLKDLGKVVLDRFAANAFEKIYNTAKNKGISFRDAEKAIIGIDHAEIAGLIAESWGFPPKLVKMIRNHHSPKDCEGPEAAIIYMADCICMMMGIGVGADGLSYYFYEDIARDLGITPDVIQEIMVDFSIGMQKVESLIGAD
ncbi:HDOD domain-containing protein [Desulforegula conservatrix]|uniref:HDOD domain-containing protein n=1 Tax=Desulforegula conservatrix TaxID=153026 RepID=UPI000428EA89|nr:HDOD domain-containing protein [Desulforegula conservatrix]